jgi:hypothetical protein
MLFWFICLPISAETRGLYLWAVMKTRPVHEEVLWWWNNRSRDFEGFVSLDTLSIRTSGRSLSVSVCPRVYVCRPMYVCTIRIVVGIVSARTVGRILIIFRTEKCIRHRSVTCKYGHSGYKNRGPFGLASKHKTAIFSKTSLTVLIQFQEFMETIPLKKKTVEVVSSGK